MSNFNNFEKKFKDICNDEIIKELFESVEKTYIIENEVIQSPETCASNSNPPETPIDSENSILKDDLK